MCGELNGVRYAIVSCGCELTHRRSSHARSRTLLNIYNGGRMRSKMYKAIMVTATNNIGTNIYLLIYIYNI